MKFKWRVLCLQLSFIIVKFAAVPSNAATERDRNFVDYSSIHPDQILNQDQSETEQTEADFIPESTLAKRVLQRGQIDCERTQCPPEESLPCHKPEVLRGNCCKACPSTRYMQRTFLPDQLLDGSPVAAPSPGDTHHALQPCVSASSDTLVFQMFSSHQYTLAFQNVRENQVQIMTWKLDSGFIGSMETTEETSNNFKRKIKLSREIYSLIGETRHERVNRFKKKIYQVMERCVPGCNKRSVVKNIRKLKLRQITYKHQC